MQSLEQNKEEVVTNYYTGEKWFLVNINGAETYVNETKYQKMKNEGSVHFKPRFS